MGDPELMELFAKFVAWQNHAATVLAEAEVIEDQAAAQVRVVEAQEMVSSMSMNTKVTQARAERDASPAIKKAHDVHLDARARKKYLQVFYANAERAAQFVSRELTRRVGRDPVQRRDMRWNP